MGSFPAGSRDLPGRLRGGLGTIRRRNSAAFRAAACCYVGGIILGAVLSVTSGTPRGGEQRPPTSMWQLFCDNAFVLLLLSAGGLTLGLVTGLVLVQNGAIFSYSAIKSSHTMPLGHVIMILAPHGVLEVIATLLAGSAGFHTLFAVIAKLDGRPPGRYRSIFLDFSVMTGLSVLLLLPAAAAEYYVSAGLAT
jgi:uncharacterized membrane protein SpoIIM required for sporulation